MCQPAQVVLMFISYVCKMCHPRNAWEHGAEPRSWMKLSEIWISGQIFVSIPNVTVHIIRVTREGEATALPFMQQDSGLVMF